MDELMKEWVSILSLPSLELLARCSELFPRSKRIALTCRFLPIEFLDEVTHGGSLGLALHLSGRVKVVLCSYLVAKLVTIYENLDKLDLFQFARVLPANALLALLAASPGHVVRIRTVNSHVQGIERISQRHPRGSLFRLDHVLQ